MNIKEIIKKSNIRFEEKKLKNIEYLIFENETILILIKSNNNVFKINRDDFDNIEQELLDYDFCLIDNIKNRFILLKSKRT